MALLWTFRYFKPLSGESDVKATHDRGSAQLRARFLSRLKDLAQLPPNEWHDNYHKHLSGYDGIEELRFKADNIQQRPLGFRSGAFEFTILVWAIEKGDKFVPKSAPETAVERRKLVLEDRRLTDALWIALE